jgi:ATP-dependent exoDNAse (exonuclease V) alpha subunit
MSYFNGWDPNDAKINKVRKLLEDNSKSLLIVGKAGVGKSTLLGQIREKYSKGIIIVAPTGIASQNVDGSTIHSYFKITPNRLDLQTGVEQPYAILPRECSREGLPKYKEWTFLAHKLKYAKILVIDEISMVSAELLQEIDFTLKTAKKNNLPFGGLKIILLGDPMQLAPVKAKWFFESLILQEMIKSQALEVIELDKVYRQKDTTFVNYLNEIRLGQPSIEAIDFLNDKVVPMTERNAKGEPKIKKGTILTYTNLDSMNHNKKGLNKLKTSLLKLDHRIEGNIFVKDTEKGAVKDMLELKVGCRVIVLKNDKDGYCFNGSTGTLESLYKADGDDLEEITEINCDLSKVRLGIRIDKTNELVLMKQVALFQNKSADYKDVNVGGVTEKIRYDKIIGQYFQFPLALGYSITIHKSQGMTIDDLLLDVDFKSTSMVTKGILYVALSRLSSSEGLRLMRPLKDWWFKADSKALQFLNHSLIK